MNTSYLRLSTILAMLFFPVLVSGQDHQPRKAWMLVDDDGELLRILEDENDPNPVSGRLIKVGDKAWDGLLLVAVRDEHDGGTLRYGYVNASGEIAIPPVFLAANHFSEGYASVQAEPGNDVRTPYILIDRSGQEVCPGVQVPDDAFVKGGYFSAFHPRTPRSRKKDRQGAMDVLTCEWWLKPKYRDVRMLKTSSRYPERYQGESPGVTVSAYGYDSPEDGWRDYKTYTNQYVRESFHEDLFTYDGHFQYEVYQNGSRFGYKKFGNDEIHLEAGYDIALPYRHGIALVYGDTCLLADCGGNGEEYTRMYPFTSLLGRYQLAPSASPNSYEIRFGQLDQWFLLTRTGDQMLIQSQNSDNASLRVTLQVSDGTIKLNSMQDSSRWIANIGTWSSSLPEDPTEQLHHIVEAFTRALHDRFQLAMNEIRDPRATNEKRIYVSPEGHLIVTGRIRDGQPVGRVTIFFRNGKRISRGSYVNGKEQGDFVITTDEYTARGRYSNGKQDGVWIREEVGGSIMEAEYDRGQVVTDLHYTYISYSRGKRLMQAGMKSRGYRLIKEASEPDFRSEYVSIPLTPGKEYVIFAISSDCPRQEFEVGNLHEELEEFDDAMNFRFNPQGADTDYYQESMGFRTPETDVPSIRVRSDCFGRRGGEIVVWEKVY